MDCFGIIIILSLCIKASTQDCYENVLHTSNACPYEYCSGHRSYLNRYERARCDTECNFDSYYELNCHNVSNYIKTTHRHDIRKIQIHSSNIPHVNEDLFAAFDNLQDLTMTGSNIRTVDSNSFIQLFKLTTINLSQNAIETLSGVFNTQLKTLLLPFNKLEDVSTILQNCSSLRELDVSHNYIDEIEIHTSCSNLLYLNAPHNNITEFGTNSTQSLMLINLNLSWNNLTISSGTFEHLDYLENLSLNNNPLFELPIGSLQNKARLRCLNLSWTRLNKIMVGSFAKLEGLEQLDLSYNNLTVLPKAIFHDLRGLKELYLHNNRFTYIQYSGLGKLSKISLDNNLWNCDTFADITHNLLQAGITIVPGSTYETENIFGIGCATIPTKTTRNYAERVPTHIGRDNYTLLNYFLQNMQQLAAEQQKLASAQYNESNSNWNMLNKQLQHFPQQLQQTIENAVYKIGSIFKSGNKTNANEVALVKIENATMNQWIAVQTNFSRILREDRIKFAKDIKSSLQFLGFKIQEYHNATIGYNTSSSLLLPVTSTEKETIASRTSDHGIIYKEIVNLNQNYKALIVGVYITAFILLFGISLLLIAKFRACKIVKYKPEECNPLNNI